MDELVLVVKPISTGAGPDGVQMSPTFNYWNWRPMILSNNQIQLRQFPEPVTSTIAASTSINLGPRLCLGPQ